MNVGKMLIASIIVALMVVGASSRGETIEFSGYTWEVRPSGSGGPGPNNWDPKNVWLDGNHWLHLKLTHRNGRWYCAEVYTEKALGFGRYQFWVIGRVDKLDKNVVFGLFNYPTDDVGPDGTHEIDIEFGRWGNATYPIGNYTVWPATTNAAQESKTFSFSLNDTNSTQRFTWKPTGVFFQSQNGHNEDDSGQFANWMDQPQNPAKSISRSPMPVHINLWCFEGRQPSDGQPVELVVRAFKFTPL